MPDIGSIESWSTAKVYRRLGRPRMAILTKEEGAGEVVEPIQCLQDMLRCSLHLCDFGHSIISGTAPEHRIKCPLMSRVPKRLHGVNPSFASIMWSFTRILVQLYLGIELAYGDGLTITAAQLEDPSFNAPMAYYEP
ncbi:hypothetical protein DL764_008760 [Monosporascus ibericus]|uniref:Protein kinase domain-containing protein n=1 Tax=Monosporascus ibericus TaxID=155417 RepID=A0A4Q4SWN7_9PEZI|nr:hypothetical protein DL764_008760 [Monosporascus ibericus]